MGTMTLYWSPRSPFVRRVMVTAHELGIADRIRCTDAVVAMTGCNADVMRMNPLNKIPTLVLEDGSVLSESALLIWNTSLPARRWCRGGARPACARCAGTGWPWPAPDRSAGLVAQRALRPAAQQSAPILDAWAAKLALRCAVLDAKRHPLRASAVSLGRVAIGCALGYLDFRLQELDWRAQALALAQWFATFDQRRRCARPSV